MFGVIWRWVAQWLCTRAYRQRVGGVWYYVKDQSAGWCIEGWTQTLEEGCTPLIVEDYRPHAQATEPLRAKIAAA